MGPTGHAVATGEDDGLDGSIQLRDGHLQSYLDGVQTEVAVFPLFGGLEHQGQRHHVGAVQLFQGLDGLGMVLPGGTTHQGQSR